MKEAVDAMANHPGTTLWLGIVAMVCCLGLGGFLNSFNDE